MVPSMGDVDHFATPLHTLEHPHAAIGRRRPKRGEVVHEPRSRTFGRCVDAKTADVRLGAKQAPPLGPAQDDVPPRPAREPEILRNPSF